MPKGIEHEDIIRLVGKGRKKLNGARFAIPDREMVDTQAMGRGVITRIMC